MPPHARGEIRDLGCRSSALKRSKIFLPYHESVELDTQRDLILKVLYLGRGSIDNVYVHQILVVIMNKKFVSLAHHQLQAQEYARTVFRS